jgi:hypothetical protein
MNTIFVCILETRERIVATGITQQAAERNAIKLAQAQLKMIPGYKETYGITEHAIRDNIELISYEVPMNGAAN